MADPSVSDPTPTPEDIRTAFCCSTGVPISVAEATFLIHHFHLKGTDAEKHKALREMVESMCTTLVGREGLQNLLHKMHARHG